MLRGWLGCFLLCIIVFLLQLVPYTGVFLMILGGPFWSVLLINMGFVLLARDSLTGAQPRWLIAFPILWFGGYLAVASLSHWQAHRFNAALATANSGKRVAWDRTTQDVVIEPGLNDSGTGSGLTPETLVQSYGLNAAFEHTPGNPEQPYRSYQLVAETCPSGNVVSHDDGTATVYLNPVDGGYGTGRPMRWTRDLCFVGGPDRPARPTVLIRPGQIGKASTGLIQTERQDIAIVSASGPAISIHAGTAQPLSWLPLPILGCALVDSTSSWDCIEEFGRESLYHPGKTRTPNAAVDVVTNALGLALVPLTARDPSVTWSGR